MRNYVLFIYLTAITYGQKNLLFISSKLLLSILLVLSFLSTYSFADDSNKTTVILGTFNYPPLMIQDTQNNNKNLNQGIGIEFIKRAFKDHSEYNLKIEFYPSKRAMTEFIKGKTDIFLGSRMDLPSISNDIIATQIFPLKSVLFCLAESCERVNNKGSFNDLGTITSIPGSPVNEFLRKKGNRVTILDNLDLTFKFWIAGRADYVAAIDFAGYYTLQKMGLLDTLNIKRANLDIMEIPYDAVILKNNKKAEKILKVLRSELKRTDRVWDPKELLKENKVREKY